MNQKILFTSLATIAMIGSALAKDPAISANTSGINDTKLINNVAVSAIASGAKEPITISSQNNGDNRQIIVTGSNGTTCHIPISNSNPPQMLRISCK